MATIQTYVQCMVTDIEPLIRVDDINKHCLDEFRKHWQCLDNNNHQLWQCRKDEWKLNKCVFDNLVCSLGFLPLTQSTPTYTSRRNSRRRSLRPRASPSTCAPNRSTPTTRLCETPAKHPSRRPSMLLVRHPRRKEKKTKTKRGKRTRSMGDGAASVYIEQEISAVFCRNGSPS